MDSKKQGNQMSSLKVKNFRKNPQRKFISVHIITSPKDNRIILTKSISYKDCVVEVGFNSDGLTKIFNKYEPRCIRAALIHDKICDGTISTTTGERIPRKTGDEYFLELLKLDGVGWLKRKRYFWAVSAYRIATFKK